jgi:myo-inositol-1(or 4)-monophosphatase
MQSEPGPQIDAATLAALERAAVRLARGAGARILEASRAEFAVHFKQAAPGASTNSNPVSDVDRDVETYLRTELAREFADHAVIGEEMGGSDGDSPFVWALDPVDGTTNFINGLPLYASAIGVLWQGWPVAGAIWCASTHTLVPGVYHARRDGPLCFDGNPLPRRGPAAWRGLAVDGGGVASFARHWDRRVFGSAAIEFAFTAAGLLRLAHLGWPSLWDAAAGVALARSAGCAVLTREGSAWVPLTRFGASGADGRERLGSWRQPILVGDEDAVALVATSAERA